MKKEKVESPLEGREAGEMVTEYCLNGSWPRMRPPALAVWLAMLTGRLTGFNLTVMSRREIMAASGVRSKDTVGKMQRELARLGYLERVRAPIGARGVAAFVVFNEPKPPTEKFAKRDAFASLSPAIAEIKAESAKILDMADELWRAVLVPPRYSISPRETPPDHAIPRPAPDRETVQTRLSPCPDQTVPRP